MKKKIIIKRSCGGMNKMYMSGNTSLSEFIRQNKAKIDKVTPVNPTISKEDEWRSESFWDNYSRGEHK